MFDASNLSTMVKSTLFQDFAASECNMLYSLIHPTTKYFLKGDILIHQGDEVNSIDIIKRGKIISEKSHYDGSANIMGVFHSDDILGLEAASSRLMTSPVTLVATEGGILLQLPLKKMLDKALVGPELKEKILQSIIHLLADENIRLIYKIDVLSKKGLREKIMTFLSIMQEKRGSDSFNIGMNHEQFAQYLCVNRSVLSNELNKLKKEGLISYKKDNYKILMNWK